MTNMRSGLSGLNLTDSVYERLLAERFARWDELEAKAAEAAKAPAAASHATRRDRSINQPSATPA